VAVETDGPASPERDASSEPGTGRGPGPNC